MGDLVRIRENAISIGAIACQLDKEKRYEEALKKYTECLDHFSHILKCELYIIV